jgi:hypothetical protein
VNGIEHHDVSANRTSGQPPEFTSASKALWNRSRHSLLN